MNNIDWISVSEKMPPVSVDRDNPMHILIAYAKTKNSICSGKTGLFMTQGYLLDLPKWLASELNPAEFWEKLGRGLCFYDYTDRQIQDLNAKNSKNFVLYWAKMPNAPKEK